MKVIFVGDYQTSEILLAPTRVGKELFNQFSKKNHEIYFYSYFQEGDKYTWVEKLFGKREITHNVYRFGFLPLLYYTIKKKPDIVFAVTPAVYYLPLLLLKKMLKFKFVYYFHSVNIHMLNNFEIYQESFKKRFLFIEKIVVRYSTLLFTLSNREANLIAKNYNSTKQKMEMVDNGIKYFVFQKHNYEIKSVLNIICIGDINRKVKAFKTLFIALKGIVKNIKLTVCSYNVQSDFLYDVSQNVEVVFLSLNERELREEISKNDLFISSSVYEPFSISLLEAMSTGIPFIATNCVGLTERFKDEILLKQVIPPNSIVDLKQKMMEFIEMTETQREILGEKGTEFSKNYSWGLVAEKTFENLNNLR